MSQENELETGSESLPADEKKSLPTWAWMSCGVVVIALICLAGAIGGIFVLERSGTDIPMIGVAAATSTATQPAAVVTEFVVTEVPVTEIAITEVVVTELMITKVAVTRVVVTEVAATEAATTERTTGEDSDVIPEDEWGNVVIGPNDPIQIAVNTVTSGAGIDVYGQTELNGAELAILEYGQIAGHDIEVVDYDTKCSAEGGLNAARRAAANESIVAVVGHTCSSSCEPAAEVYDDAHLTMVSPSCTAGWLTEKEAPRAFMRTGYNDNFQGRAAAEFAYRELGLDTAATIHDGSPYAVGLVDTFGEYFESLGGTIVTADAVNVGDTDMSWMLSAIADYKPDMIYFPIFPAEGAFITVQSEKTQGLENVTLMGADGIRLDTFLEAAGGAAEGVYASGPTPLSGHRYENFLDAYEDAYGEEPPAPFGPESYDAMTLVLKAIEAVAVEDDQGNLVIGRKALREAMYASDFEGVTGTIACDEFGDCGPGKTEIVQVVNGEFVVVDQNQR